MLYITRQDILFADSLYKKSDGPLSLGFVENYSGNKKTKIITQIQPVYITKKDCSNAIKLIKKTLKGRPEKDILEEIYAQLYFRYGKPDERAVNELYSSIK